MTLVKLGAGKYINVDRMTYVEAGRRRTLAVHFDVGGGDIPCQTILEAQEAQAFTQWLDAHSDDATA
jgi:hypothetical protein